MLNPLEYNLVDAYERELNDWWYEIPPIVDRFQNVISPCLIEGVYNVAQIDSLLEEGPVLKVVLEVE